MGLEHVVFFSFHSCWKLRNCSLGAERISEECVTQDHTSSEGSPGLQKSTPEKNETSNFEKGISPSNLCLQKKNTQNMYLNQSPEMTVKKLTFGNKSFSPVLTASYLVRILKLLYRITEVIPFSCYMS